MKAFFIQKYKNMKLWVTNELILFSKLFITKDSGKILMAKESNFV